MNKSRLAVLSSFLGTQKRLQNLTIYKFISTLILTCLSAFLYSQDYKGLFRELYPRYDLVVEAEIVESEAFYCTLVDEDGRYGDIYTRHKLRITRVFKGDTSLIDLSQVNIITEGGKLPEENRWQLISSHGVHVSVGSRFVAFLNKASKVECAQESDYELFVRYCHLRLRMDKEPSRIYVPPFATWIDYSEFIKILNRIAAREKRRGGK